MPVLLGSVSKEYINIFKMHFKPYSNVYSSKHNESGIVVTKDEYGQKLINPKTEVPVFFPKKNKVVKVGKKYLTQL